MILKEKKLKIVEEMLREERDLIEANINLRQKNQKLQKANKEFETQNQELEDSYKQGKSSILFDQFAFGGWAQRDPQLFELADYVDPPKYRQVGDVTNP
jgi:hypothetical protein